MQKNIKNLKKENDKALKSVKELKQSENELRMTY